MRVRDLNNGCRELLDDWMLGRNKVELNTK